MNRLQSELRRLYLTHDTLLAPDGRTRTLVLQVAGPGAWTELGKAWQGVQADLRLPPPAIAVTGEGYQLWFSLEEPVPAAEALSFGESLRQRYLGEVAPARLTLHPAATQPAGHVAAIPPFEQGPERWSAFIAPDLAPLFADDPWLDLAPGADAQAELLSRLQTIRPADLRAALDRLQAAATPATATPAHPDPAAPAAAPLPQHDPRAFLLAVMNDPAVDLRLRIEAAKALLVAGEPRRDR